MYLVGLVCVWTHGTPTVLQVCNEGWGNPGPGPVSGYLGIVSLVVPGFRRSTSRPDTPSPTRWSPRAPDLGPGLRLCVSQGIVSRGKPPSLCLCVCVPLTKLRDRVHYQVRLLRL